MNASKADRRRSVEPSALAPLSVWKKLGEGIALSLVF